MKEVLIIRSVSFQQLDLNLAAITERYRGCRISILTHEHGLLLAQKYQDIDQVYVYPFKEGFNFLRPVKELRGKVFDTVIIPVSNLSGAGFLNVLFFSLTIKCQSRTICNLVSELRPVTPGQIIRRSVTNKAWSLISLLLTLFLAIPVLLLLPFGLKRIEKTG
jgi:hypothetical protein